MDKAESISADQMKMVLDVSRMLAVTTDLDPLLLRIAEATTSLLHCERASIFLHDPATGELWTKVALQSKEIRVPFDKGIVGSCFERNAIEHVPAPYDDLRFNPAPDQATGFLTRNLLAAPMVDLDRKALGVLEAINKVGGGFSRNDMAMAQMLADQAGVAIQRYRLQLAAMEMGALRHEMELAKRVQEGLIPDCPPGIVGLDCGGWTRPASITGGDCFDLWQLEDGRLGIFVGDASGHGIAPALIVSQARSIVRAMSEIETNPHRLFGRINRRLAVDLDGERFCTAFLAFLSPDGRMEWTSAGHGPVLVRTRKEDAFHTLDTPAPPLGIDFEWNLNAEPVPEQLEPGGTLVVMSDGIFEAVDTQGKDFGVDQMKLILDLHRHLPPGEHIASLRDAVRAWMQKEEPDDDQTIVIVQRR